MGLYDDRRAIALGLALPPEEPAIGGGMFDVQPSFGMREEVFNQYFDKKCEAPPAQTRYKTGLEFTDESAYNKERKAAKKNLETLELYLANGKADKIRKLFNDHPAAEWLNHVFLEEKEVAQLIRIVEKTSPECLAEVVKEIDTQLLRLVNFRSFFDELRKLAQSLL
jgi:hypothetical protein